jgi:hypothetical protein
VRDVDVVWSTRCYGFTYIFGLFLRSLQTIEVPLLDPLTLALLNKLTEIIKFPAS